jgi:L-threonylcarbamoyladenylate synthase
MRVVTVDPLTPAPEALREAAEALAAGLVVAFPTDTLYGLAVDPRNARAVERVYAVKGRGLGQPLPLIACDETQVADQAGALTPLARRLARGFWPGPLALVLDARPSLDTRVHAATGRVAVRVPAHALARALARTVGHPITATSANIAGEPAATTATELSRALAGRIDLVLDGGPTTGGLPSTIVDATGSTPALVRAGVVPWARVLEFLKCPPSADTG